MVRARLQIPSAALAATLLALAPACPTWAQPTAGQVKAGRRLAQDHCAMCHAIGGGDSPLPNAPAFRDLFRRLAPDKLDAVLAEGIAAPGAPPGEGRLRPHPHMPVGPMGADRRAELKAYLRALVGGPRPKR